MKSIGVGKHIQAEGEIVRLKDTERIIATRIYIEDTFTAEHPCNQEPDPGSCKAAIPRYYFDTYDRMCKEFLWGGCDGTVPFDTKEVCRKTCEKDSRAVPAMPALTRQRCADDGSRVVDIADSGCAEDEISIGAVEGEAGCSCICYMNSDGTGWKD